MTEPASVLITGRSVVSPRPCHQVVLRKVFPCQRDELFSRRMVDYLVADDAWRCQRPALFHVVPKICQT